MSKDYLKTGRVTSFSRPTPAQHPGSDAARLGPRSEAPMVHSRVYAEAIALGVIILISTTMALSQSISERFPGPGNLRFIPEKIGRPLAATDLVKDIK